jgi:predicted component of type VI protein secretion system
MTYQLIPSEQGNSTAISLHRPVLLIGRHPECDVRIDLPKISRRHCCVALAYDRVLIRDLGSRNGLRINGHVVEEARLEPGDEVAIGPLIYRVVGDADELSASATGQPAVSSSGKPKDAFFRPGQVSAPVPAADDSDDVGLIPIEDI